MSVWGDYEERISNAGGTIKNASYIREARIINNRIVNSLSFHSVTIDDVHQDVSIANSDNLNEKVIFSKPGEDLRLGGLVYWMNNHWLITEKDANTTLYTRAKLLQCNYLLKWVTDDDQIIEQWCVVEDGTKYLTGEYEDRNFIVTRGDSRIAITIAKNEFTAKLGRNNRFLIDDPDSKVKLAYILSKPLKFAGVYNEEGVYKFVLQEVVTTDFDNQELMIADYYKHFPKETEEGDEDNTQDIPEDNENESADTTNNSTNGKKVWI